MHHTLSFGDFQLHIDRGELRKGDERVELQPAVYEGLKYFAEHPGVLHGREDLHTALWPGVHVADDALSQLIRKLRLALGDSARSPRYIETVARRGYRFVAEVQTGGHARERTPPKSTLHGRESDLERIVSSVAGGAGIVTITGLGGMGKSYLARAAMETLGADFDRRLSVDLQEQDTPSGLVHAVARALEAPLLDDHPDEERAQVGHALAGGGHLLCLLDDLDQLVGACEATLAAWRTAAPDVTWLFTSRRPMGLPGERVVELRPLPAEGARALFKARAAAVGRDDLDEGESLDALLFQLDYSPLAIELAAARTRVLGVAQLERRIGERFRLLRERHGDRPERHRSLLACLLASWDRLGDDDRDTLARLSVFRGGFFAGTAEALLVACGVEQDPLDVLDDLRSHGLLSLETVPGGEPILKLLESVAALVRSREEVAEVRRNAASHLVGALLSRVDRLDAEDPIGAERVRIAAQLTDLLPSLDDANQIAQVLRRISIWLRQRGPINVGKAAVRRAEAGEMTAESRAMVAVTALVLQLDRHADIQGMAAAAAATARKAGREDLAFEAEINAASHAVSYTPDRTPDSEALLAKARELGVPRYIADTARTRSRVLMREDVHAAARLLQDQLPDLPSGVARADVEDMLGRALCLGGRNDDGIAAMESSMAVYRRLGWRRKEAVILGNLHHVYVTMGRKSEAHEAARRASDILRRTGQREIEALLLVNTAIGHLHDGDAASALPLLERCRALSFGLELDPLRAEVMLGFAAARWLEGDEAEARRCADEALALAVEQDDELTVRIQSWRENPSQKI